MALYWYQTFRFMIRLRAGLISLVYQQTVQARSIDLGDITGLTLMGTDVDRIVLGFRSIHEVWASLLEIILSVYLLSRQLYVACIMPGLLTLGLSGKISTLNTDLANYDACLSFYPHYLQAVYTGQDFPEAVDRKGRETAEHHVEHVGRHQSCENAGPH